MSPEARRRRLVASGLAIVLLALGAAAGVAGDRLLLRDRLGAGRHGPPSPAEMVNRMSSELDLTDAQARAILPILEERRDALSRLFAPIASEAEAVRKATDERIRALLQPAQRERFERRVAEQERRRAEIRTRAGGAREPPP